jgi:WD40 repeat protein
VTSQDGYLRIIDAASERSVSSLTLLLSIYFLDPDLQEKLLRLTDAYTSYYGGFTCLAWSPDGRFVLVSMEHSLDTLNMCFFFLIPGSRFVKTGGQDDLVTVFAPHEGRVVARCPGHSSFVSGIAFDPWKSDHRTHRFASVSEDCRLILVSVQSVEEMVVLFC